MTTTQFTLRQGESFIPLNQLLKATNLVYTGSEANIFITQGDVLRNGEVELRKRAKITAGEEITFQDHTIRVLEK
ncbi:MAG: RNA-binding S4 domain-containing protein [Paludibacter sp.]|nr:RNA-binding S4 domain-containing protein [Bacteroidales bacterium]MCM1068582.1 RNA-binding S4 domain-containing protein [Prevotella sp.]MCM1353246.1 RNA-binding S4 domain-containing protein [Bacteroides sp.]MCM1442346.1 RNA-binding S4 domain-containing protein [Muribaculum sp.]MCM1481165.1 RNA-binding S4 domain-containing protein [Paludibacter sp.]